MLLQASFGFAIGFLSLQADALHRVTDIANNLLGLVTNNFSSPQSDREHSYGRRKYEALGALGIATFSDIWITLIVLTGLLGV